MTEVEPWTYLANCKAALAKATGTRWSAVTIGAHTGAALQLSSGTAMISISGFSGCDPAPMLEEFQAMVAAGEVHYFVGDGGPDGFGGHDPAQLAEQDPQLAEMMAQVE